MSVKGGTRRRNITVVLLNRHVAALDQICVNIRATHRHAIARSEVIQAVIEAAMRRGVDPADFVGRS